MMNEIFYEKYVHLLTEYKSTLKKTSKAKAEAGRRKSYYMTESMEAVVDFDCLKEKLMKLHAPSGAAKSCDALYMKENGDTYLIEFKSGRLDRKDFFDIKMKMMESAFLLLDTLQANISYSREHLTFLLVYRGEYEYHDITDSLDRMAGGESELVKKADLKRFEKLYFKKVEAFDENDFHEHFVKKHFS